MEAAKHNLDLTEGVIWKKFLLFLLPIAIGTLFQQFYSTVDAVIVGQFVGADALAAVGGSAAVIVQLVVGIFTGRTPVSAPQGGSPPRAAVPAS